MRNNSLAMLDFCLKCSICHTQCPVVAKKPDYPGPKQLGPEAERLRLTGKKVSIDELDKHLEYCLNCKRCDEACPHGVKPSLFNLKNKASTKGPLRDWILAHNSLWGKVASQVPAVSNFFLKQPLIKKGMGIVGIAPQREFPAYKKRNINVSSETKDKKALYFRGCYATYNEPEIAQATVDLLEYAGYQVEIAPSECCGTPLVSNGLHGEAKKLAEKNINTLSRYVDKGYKIVTSCPSCTLALKEEYSELFVLTGASLIGKNIWDIHELLLHEGIQIPSLGKKYSRAFYHVPCHLKAQGIGIPAVPLLKEAAVESLTVNDKYCCGISGTFGFKKEKFNLSLEIGSDLFETLKNNSPSLVITDCGTCKIQIEHGTGIEAVHPSVILAKTLKSKK